MNPANRVASPPSDSNVKNGRMVCPPHPGHAPFHSACSHDNSFFYRNILFEFMETATYNVNTNSRSNRFLVHRPTLEGRFPDFDDRTR